MTETLDSLKAKAVEKAGFRDFGDDWFEQPLAAWAADLGGPLLNATGRAFLARLAVTNLCRRLEVLDWFNRHPEIDDVPIPRILYITGLERSGTTFLHNLLALHSRARALLRWELMRPAPPPESKTHRTDPRIAEVQASVEPLRGTLLEQMHWVDAGDPEECVWGAFDCTGLLGQAASTLMPTWSRWLRAHDLTPSYREYRRLIKLLTWRNPLEPGGHLVLKCPQNSRHMAELASVFPEARFIFTHRDPYRTCVSTCMMVNHITAAFAAQKDLWHPDGPAVAGIVEGAELGLRRMVEFDEASHQKVAHVAYPALVKDPSEVVREIYRRFDIDAPQDLGLRIAEYVAAQAAGKRAAPPRNLPTYGLDHQRLLSRPVVATYCRRFGVVPEVSRLTGT